MITAGAGSVILLWGDPGDLVVEIRHLKQPAEQFLDTRALHDKSTGTFELVDKPDLKLLVNKVKAITVKDVASHLFSKKNPSKNEIEKARYKLEGMVKAGEARKIATPTGKAGKDEVTYSISEGVEIKSEAKSDDGLKSDESDKSDEPPE